MTPDEKRRLYVLMDRQPRYDITIICFWALIGITGWAFLAVLGWAIWSLFKFLGGSS